MFGYRVASTQYGPISPRERRGSAQYSFPDSNPYWSSLQGSYARTKPVDRSGWSRFDTPGSTIYLSSDRRTAYAETLAHFRITPKDRSAIAFAAETFGWSWEQARKQIEDDFLANGNEVPWRLPFRWREDRKLHRLYIMEPLRWVDLTTFETIAALNEQLGPVLAQEAGVEELTLEHLMGGSRDLTTYIAEWIRRQVFDDGSSPAGVTVFSKHGGGTCWAYWLRRHDAGLGQDWIRSTNPDDITYSDDELLEVLERFGIEP